ncbi:MAG: hypothetical protein WAW03_04540 [Anaerolineae bacterium]|uniref:hypothetical protein n=1 Tax=Candidatus Amarolinea dominans TaxID=3140696 RepID=UPI001D753AF4|nr:hypothetical protein [Anaerolineae bacterium]MBK7203702.1 hypothetical protein [Anaerolineae bacterium]MBK9091475.1 hypothetical protein [Anaerolineae bacterium]MBK9230420.1 hypothetical protein [Anaerolineae bacterium]
MNGTSVTPFQAALDVIDRLPPDDQEAIIEIIRRRMIEQRRREIAANAQMTLQAFRERRASYGTVDDLRRELEA